MDRTGRACLLLVAVTAACSRLPPLEVLLLSDPGVSARLILIERDGAMTDSVMLGPSGEGASALPVIAANEQSTKIRIVALGFSEKLEDLGVAAGALKLASAGEPGARPLPAFIQAQELISDHTSVSPWGPLDPSKSDPRRLWLPRDIRCFAFRHEQIALTTTHTLGAVEQLQDGSMLIGVKDVITTDFYVASWFQVKTDRSVTPIEAPVGRPYINRVYADPSGTLWLGDDNGGLWSGHLVDNKLDAVKVEQIAPPVSAPCIRDGTHLCEENTVGWIVGPKSASDPFELFLMTSKGDVFRRDAGGPAVPIFSFPPPAELPYGGEMLWLGPSQVVAVVGGDPDIRFWDHGVESRLMISGETGFLTLGDSAAAGPLVATSDRVYGFDKTGSRLLLDAAPSVRIIADFPGGFMVGRSGAFTEQVVATGRCGELQIAAGSVDRIKPFGDGWILVSDHPGDLSVELAATLLHRE